MEAGLLRDAINQGVDIGGGTDETSLHSMRHFFQHC